MSEQLVSTPVPATKKPLAYGIAAVIILILAIGGYLMLRMAKKPKEMVSTSNSKLNTQDIPAPSPRNIVLSDQPKVEPQTSFYLKTDKTTYKIGEIFDIKIYINALGEKVDGAEFVLQYDPQLVEVDQPKLGTFFSLYPQKIVDPQKGTVRIIALQKPSENKNLNEELIATLSVNPKQPGTINFSFVKEKTHIAGYGGQELLKEANPLTIIVE